MLKRLSFVLVAVSLSGCGGVKIPQACEPLTQVAAAVCVSGAEGSQACVAAQAALAAASCPAYSPAKDCEAVKSAANPACNGAGSPTMIRNCLNDALAKAGCPQSACFAGQHWDGTQCAGCQAGQHMEGTACAPDNPCEPNPCPPDRSKCTLFYVHGATPEAPLVPSVQCDATPPPPPLTCPTGQHLDAGACVPDVVTPPTPPPPSCPATCPDDAKTMNARCLHLSPPPDHPSQDCSANPDGCKCTTDSTPRCGDKGNDGGYCGKVTGDPSITHCKAAPEGAALELACNTPFLGGPCPIWEGSTSPTGPWQRLLPDGIDADGNPTNVGRPMSIDHLDGWAERDGTYTGPCQAAKFGLHAPIAAFGGVPHGDMIWVRSCTVDGLVCSDPVGPIKF